MAGRAKAQSQSCYREKLLANLWLFSVTESIPGIHPRTEHLYMHHDMPQNKNLS